MICRKISPPAARFGTTAVEMALVAPVILLVFFASMEFARLVMIQQALTNAAREGARVASLATTESSSDVETTILLLLASTFQDEQLLQISTTPDELQNMPSGTKITTEISVNFSSVSWFPPSWCDQIVMIGNASLRRE